MVPVLGVFLFLAVAVAAFFITQASSARAEANLAAAQLKQLQERTSSTDSEAKKHEGALEAKRKEIEELKEKLKDAKKKRHEDAEDGKFKRDLDRARQELEREIEKKLVTARDEAELARQQAKKLTAEIEQLRSRRPAPVAAAPSAAPSSETPAAAPSTGPATPPAERPVRAATPEEVARLDAAEKSLSRTKAKVEELERELKKSKGRAETDNRVFIVQRGEIELGKDRFRTLETRYNALALDREDLARALWELEKEVKTLGGSATAESKLASSKAFRQAKATKDAGAKPAEAMPEGAAPAAPEAAADGQPAKA